MIKNIIFDFGDIFINLDKNATYRELMKLGVTSIDESMISIYHQYEKGHVSTEQFVDYYHDRFAIGKSDLISAWNAILLDFPLERLQFLKRLSQSKTYRLFLLSNTNQLHISWIKDNWGEKMYDEFKMCFEQFYLSHEIHLRKPDASIYEFVLSSNKLLAEETLFVDDLKENTEAASKLGLLTWNLEPGKEDVVQLLSKKEFF